MNPPAPLAPAAASWWSAPVAELLGALRSSADGLAQAAAADRLAIDGPNLLQHRHEWPLVARFLARLANPLIAVLLVASIVSALLGDHASFAFVAIIVLLSVTLDFVQEHRAGQAALALQHSVALRARVLRDGAPCELPVADLVRGDVVLLAAGSLVPADGRLLEAKDLFVNQAALTGEAYPVEKRASPELEEADSPASSGHTLLMGSSVVSGTARLLLCATGGQTTLGSVAHSLAGEPPPTSFERGARGFSMLLTRMTITLVLFVLLVNALQHRPLLDSFMFAVALAVGLTPELLPMIVSVTLARGALRMARQKVIVKRLSAIEDLGAMDVLATDKTGTLTEARIRLEQHLDPAGRDSPRVLELAQLNSHFETGLKSPLDEAILAHSAPDVAAWRKLDEVPFDFERRRVSVLVEQPGQRLLVVKGAPEDLVALCVARDGEGEPVVLDDAARAALAAQIEAFGQQGLRVLGVATRRVEDNSAPMSAADEHALVFAGFLTFLDPPKLSAGQALRDLHACGISCRIVTGDNEAVTQHLAAVLGLPVHGVLTGKQVAAMDDLALSASVAHTNLFCRVTPEQKSRIVLALKARGHVVGYLGDGINDATALHSADIGISVDDAVDVAKQAADLVLMERDLSVLRQSVLEGRRTFVNVMKYIMMATSSNFGNMVSMAAAALFVPFLPMLPVQILLNNFLYDLSEVALPLDHVDSAQLRRPKTWDIGFIRNFMLALGTLSSLFDLLTFALLIEVLKAGEATFQTAWFVESMATQVLVVFVIRTRKLPWRSRPSLWLSAATLATAAGAVALPFTPLGAAFGFVPLPLWFLAALAGMTAVYLVCAEGAKQLFYRLMPLKRPRHRPPRIGRPARTTARRNRPALTPKE